MKVKRFTAANMQQALRMVSQELGADAVILSSKKVTAGIEVVAALDYQSGNAQHTAEVDRQLRLQQELEAAKVASREPQTVAKRDERREEREAYARRADVSSRDGLSAVLSGLKKDTLPQDRSAPLMPPESEPEEPVLRRASDCDESWYSNALAQMTGELRELKDWMVSHQGSAWDSRRPLTWQQSQLWQRCQDVGLEPAWADRITSRLDANLDLDDAWARALKLIAGDLPIAPTGMIERGGMFALVGPTGAGKTTTIGKLAAQFVIRNGADSVALVTLDNYRVAAHDQLKTFSRILGVAMHTVPAGGDLGKVLDGLKGKKLVLVDSAGLGSQDPHFGVQLSMLKKAGARLRKLLVLPLTSQGRCLQENYEHFKAAGLTGCVFTKLDECFSLGPALSVAALTHLPVTLVTDGPHIPDDVHYPDAVKLVSLAEQMARMARTRWQAAEAMNFANQQSGIQHGA
ncbi:flagellar biosynthesis protein FlhF [Thalassolituus sp. LLYu03]|uniref:flagellar biosynthesis protein FlhF n=1 Tax=Thalassolituus sp. LLYu03 TaxID=3421656 RepID=UPI003D2786A1